MFPASIFANGELLFVDPELSRVSSVVESDYIALSPISLNRFRNSHICWNNTSGFPLVSTSAVSAYIEGGRAVASRPLRTS